MGKGLMHACMLYYVPAKTMKSMCRQWSINKSTEGRSPGQCKVAGKWRRGGWLLGRGRPQRSGGPPG